MARADRGAYTRRSKLTKHKTSVSSVPNADGGSLLRMRARFLSRLLHQRALAVVLRARLTPTIELAMAAQLTRPLSVHVDVSLRGEGSR